jgi:hypothetical protein
MGRCCFTSSNLSRQSSGTVPFSRSRWTCSRTAMRSFHSRVANVFRTGWGVLSVDGGSSFLVLFQWVPDRFFFKSHQHTHLLEYVFKIDTTLVSIAHISETSRFGVSGEINCVVADCYGTTTLAILCRYHAKWKALQGERQLVQNWGRHL